MIRHTCIALGIKKEVSSQPCGDVEVTGALARWRVPSISLPNFKLPPKTSTTKTPAHSLCTFKMGLVDYSDSDASDVEEAPKVSVKSTPISTKPAFQKVVDRSNPSKIRVSLPQTVLKDEFTSDEPPAKKLKTGGGISGGFNSFLPPPKRTGQISGREALGPGKVAKKGLGAGVSLKTGATPGFSREPEPDRSYEEDAYGKDDKEKPESVGSGLSLPLPKTTQSDEQNPAEEVKLVGKPLMFKPLSVARKPAKKKKAMPPGTTAQAVVAPALTTPAVPQPEKPVEKVKVSLFSMSGEPISSSIPKSSGEYQPMLYESNDGEDEADVDQKDFNASYEDYTPTTTHMAPPAVPTPPTSQSLDEIAGDLNLSAAERRQLFGRQKGSRGMQAATKIINFNTDEEYLHNEELRAAGEQVMHNPVRAIAPGKHSLKQLVNAAQNQKEALEESFAKGKSNRAEASSKYGW